MPHLREITKNSDNPRFTTASMTVRMALNRDPEYNDASPVLSLSVGEFKELMARPGFSGDKERAEAFYEDGDFAEE